MKSQSTSADHGSSPSAPRAPGAPRRVLITGGAGFIGSHLTDLLLQRGDQVTIIDNLSTGSRDNLPTRHPQLRFVEADLAEALAAFGKGECFDQIYHLAAAVGVRRIVDDPILTIETNVLQTGALLRFALHHGPDRAPAPVLLASTSEVYGKSEHVPFREDDDVVYGPTTKSRWAYGCSKAIDEYLALAYHAKQNLPVVVVRLFNTVGPRQVGRYGMVLPSFVEAALHGRDLEIYGDGRQSRCFCDVRDVAAALPRLLETPACAGRVFNLGADTPVTIAELADVVIRTLGSPSRTVKIPYDQAYAPGFEDLPRRRPDLSRIREAIGFEPKISLEETIRDLASAMSAGGPARAGAGA